MTLRLPPVYAMGFTPKTMSSSWAYAGLFGDDKGVFSVARAAVAVGAGCVSDGAAGVERACCTPRSAAQSSTRPADVEANRPGNRGALVHLQRFGD